MSKPIVAAIHPKKVSLAVDEEYYFCTCGRSRNQPFCDGSHAGTEFKPKLFKAEETGDAYLCQCKHSANSPFCDGSHKQFDDNHIGKEGLDLAKNAAESPVGKATKTNLR